MPPGPPPRAMALGTQLNQWGAGGHAPAGSRAKPGGARGEASPGRGFLALVAHLHVGNRSVLGAVWLARAWPRRRRSGSCACPARRAASSRSAGAACVSPPAAPAPGRAWPAPARTVGRSPRAGRRRQQRGRRRGGERRQGGAGHPAGRPGARPRRLRRRGGSATGRAVRFSRCALPTTAFFEMPMRRPISAVECPSAQRSRRRAIVSSVHSISWDSLPATTRYGSAMGFGSIAQMRGRLRKLWINARDTPTSGFRRYRCVTTAMPMTRSAGAGRPVLQRGEIVLRCRRVLR